MPHPLPFTLPFSAQMTDKRAALAAEIVTTLAAHESGWTVTERYELGTERPGGSKAQRDGIMGTPIKYCRVAQISRGPRGETDSDVMGAARQVEHVFMILLYRQFDDTVSDNRAWRDILESHSPVGVYVHLDGLGRPS